MREIEEVDCVTSEEDTVSGPVLTLQESNPLPKYQQIVEQVKSLVAEGALAPGTPLPSVRQLAADLGINVNTVVAAYRVLEADGILLLRHGSRAVVHPRWARPASPAPADVERVRGMLARVRTEAVLAGVSLEELRLLASDVFEG